MEQNQVQSKNNRSSLKHKCHYSKKIKIVNVNNFSFSLERQTGKRYYLYQIKLHHI